MVVSWAQGTPCTLPIQSAYLSQSGPVQGAGVGFYPNSHTRHFHFSELVSSPCGQVLLGR